MLLCYLTAHCLELGAKLNVIDRIHQALVGAVLQKKPEEMITISTLAKVARLCGQT